MRKRLLLAGVLFNSLTLPAQQPVIAGYLGQFDGQFAPVMINQQKQWLHISGAVLVDKTENQGYFNTVVAVKHNAYGAISNTGKIIAPFKYDEVTLADEKDDNDPAKNYCFVITRLNGKFGAMDTLGNVLAAPVYNGLEAMTPHVAKVKQNGRWGWIDIKTGQVLQAPLYEEVGKSYVTDYTVQITKAGKVGLAREDGTILVSPEYESFQYMGGGQYFGFATHNKVGIMDKNGQIIVKAVYDQCSEGPGPGLFSVTLKGKTGFVDVQGKEIIPPQYTTSTLMGNTAKVGTGKKYGLVNAAGKAIIPVKYDDIRAINAAGQEVISGPTIVAPGQAAGPVYWLPAAFLVTDQGKTGLFDTTGKQITPMVYNEMMLFSYQDKPYLAVQQNGKAGLLTIDGKVLVPPVYDGFPNGFSVGASYIETNAGSSKANYIPVMKGEGLGLFNMVSGKEILPPVCSWIQWQNSDILYLRKGDDTTLLADKTGKIIRGAKKYGFYTAVDSNRIVETEYPQDGSTRCMLTDLAGNILYTNPRWEFKEDRASRLLMDGDAKSGHAQFNNGLLKIWGDYRNNVFVDINGKEVIFDGYDFVGDFWNGLALAGKNVTPEHMLYGIINRNKEVVYPISADDFYELNGLLGVKKDTLKSLIRKDGRVVLPMDYTNIDNIYQVPFLKVTRNGKEGITDTLGKIILAPEYDDISYQEDVKLFRLTRGEKQGIADVTGKVIIPVIYDELDTNHGYDKNIFPLLVKEGKWYFYLDRQGKPFPYKSLKKKGYDD